MHLELLVSLQLSKINSR